MLERLRELSETTFSAHGYCYFWTSELIWLHVVSDALIGLSYVAISLTLAYLVHRIRNLPFHWMFLAFGLFIIACGATHFMEILVIWKAHYWWQGFIKAITAIASVATALLLPPLVPRALALVRAAELSGQRRDRLEAKNKELEALCQKIQELDEVKSQGVKRSFLSLVSHELRTPLTAINLCLQSLQRDREGSLSCRQQEMVQRIAGSSRRLLDLIESLLEYATFQHRKLVTHAEEFDLVAVVANIIDEWTAQAKQKQLALHLVSTPELPTLRTDARLLRLIVNNLVDNALKYTAQGKVEVTLAVANELHVLTVRDTGPGIPLENQSMIFEAFAHLEPVHRKHSPGVGLGLTLVKEMVQVLGGRIELQSEVGVGSVFTVFLPSMPASTPVAERETLSAM
jgi:signal transduction histidine kinase